MAIAGKWGIGRGEPCTYLAGRTARFEHLAIDHIDAAEFDALIGQGYRHFGATFFRPCCEGCRACIPIRVPTAGYHFPRSARKVFHRARELDLRLTRPRPSQEAYALYLLHRQRFHDPQGRLRPDPPFAAFADALFHPFPFSYALEVRDGDRLVAVAHFDRTRRVLSAVYTYHDPAWGHYSLGRLAVYREIAMAIEADIPHVYLGYYIADNAHMAYKADYRPSELLLGHGEWTPFMDRNNRRLPAEEAIRAGFQSPGRPQIPRRM
ncbi:MAG: GNAT family N-acetyltransferase [Lentisphaeria bacterium]|nr:GNAT family N-acetyltransferase [Lentisphaeria bacterium]